MPDFRFGFERVQTSQHYRTFRDLSLLVRAVVAACQQKRADEQD
jgi:hypothetical protein